MLLSAEEVVKTYEFKIEGVNRLIFGKITKDAFKEKGDYFWFLNYYSGAPRAAGSYVPSQNQFPTIKEAERSLLDYANTLSHENGFWIDTN